MATNTSACIDDSVCHALNHDEKVIQPGSKVELNPSSKGSGKWRWHDGLATMLFQANEEFSSVSSGDHH